MSSKVAGLTQEGPGFHTLRVNPCGSLQEGLGIFVVLGHDGQDSTHHQAAGEKNTSLPTLNQQVPQV